jgi:hypothetical protein
LESASDFVAHQSVGRYVVAARDGVRLRKGPGLEFAATRTLASGTELSVLGFDGTGHDWARVDLKGDNQVDGHVFLAFLRETDASEPSERVEEPGA